MLICMPTVLQKGPYRFHFFSDEGIEPAHIHVRFEGTDCKFWLIPVSLSMNRGVPLHRLNEIEKIIREKETFFLTKYDEHRRRQF
mgnify:CR=1 FL=1